MVTFPASENHLRLRNDLYCVEWGVKLYSLTHSLQRITVPPLQYQIMLLGDGISAVGESRTHDLQITSPTIYHYATTSFATTQC